MQGGACSIGTINYVHKVSFYAISLEIKYPFEHEVNINKLTSIVCLYYSCEVDELAATGKWETNNNAQIRRVSSFITYYAIITTSVVVHYAIIDMQIH